MINKRCIFWQKGTLTLSRCTVQRFKKNIAVDMTTRLGLDDLCISTFPDQLWGQSSLPFSGKWGLIPWRQSDRGVRLTTH